YTTSWAYNTASNKARLIVSFCTKKVGQTPKSARDMCLDGPQGVHAVRPKGLARVSKTKKLISSAYSGTMCARCVRARIKGLSLSRGSPYQGAENSSENVEGSITESESKINMELFLKIIKVKTCSEKTIINKLKEKKWKKSKDTHDFF
ncbi:60S ribosomal protein L34, partial [Lemmus lemmus]